MGLTSEHERRLASDPTRHAHVARTVFRLRDVFEGVFNCLCIRLLFERIDA